MSSKTKAYNLTFVININRVITRIMKKLLKIIFSPRTTLGLLVIFAIAMAVATFIENSYDTTTAKLMIYNAKWFELLMILMILNFI